MRETLANVQIQVRDARLTDIDRVIGMMERSDGRLTLDGLRDAGDVLRQMLYLPNATLMVALDGRMVVGAAALVLRPSVTSGGLVGTIDMLMVEPGSELDGVAEALLTELIRQSRNKGCRTLEGKLPSDAHEFAAWEALGFAEAHPQLRHVLASTPAAVG